MSRECLHLQEMAHMEAWLCEMPHVAKETEKQTSNQKERWEENGKGYSYFIFSSVQSLSCVQLFATP